MTLAQEVIQAASQPGLPLADLLRKAKVLAVHCGDQEMRTWIARELDGYGGDELPAYRGPFPADARADFYGRGGIFKNTPIAPQGLPDFVRESDLFVTRLPDGVAELEDLLDARNYGPDTRGLGAMWPTVSVGLINEMLRAGMAPQYAGMTIVEAWTPISPSLVRSVLDAVRNRVLDYALAIEARPDSAVRQHDVPATAPTYNTTIHTAPGANIAIGSMHFQQNQGLPAPRTEQELLSQLREIGIPAELLSELRDALEKDRRDAGGDLKEPGSRVREWIGKAAVLGAKSSGGVGIAAAGGVGTQLLLQYFGLLPH